jgi:small subunit ribosomal protein S6
MHFYETLYLLNPDLPEDEYKGLVERYSACVERGGGVIIEVAPWGKRSLAYPVKKFASGYYVLLQYCGESATVNGLQHEMRLDEKVLKFQTVKIKENADPEKIKQEKGAASKQRPQAAPKAEEPEAEDSDMSTVFAEETNGDNDDNK